MTTLITSLFPLIVADILLSSDSLVSIPEIHFLAIHHSCHVHILTSR